MKKSFFEKIISFMLAAIMIFGVFPITALAEEVFEETPGEGVFLDKENLIIMEFGKAVLTAEVVPEEKKSELVWESSDESIVSVSNGEVTALSVGTATVTARAGEYFDECKITVTEFVPYVSDIHLSESSFINTEGTAFEFPQDPEFGGKNFEYNALAQDTYTRAFVWATLSEDAPEGTAITAKWINKNGKETTKEIEVSDKKGTYISGFIAKGILGNTVTFEVGVPGDIQTYTINVERTPSLSGLSVFDEKGEEIRLDKGFAADTTFYSLSTSDEKLMINAEAFDESYKITYNGSENNVVELSEGENSIEVKVTNNAGYSKSYTVLAEKIGLSKISFDVSPADALVFVLDKYNSRVWPNENGDFELLHGEKYTYSAAAKGYKGVLSEYIPDGSAEIEIKLEKAAKTSFKQFDSSWPSFGFSKENNIVIDRPTPLVKDETALYWANKIGEGYDYGATGVPILVDDYLYCYAGKTIMKIDKMSGEVVQTGVMTGGASAYAICSLTYAEGLVFVGLNNGTVQAFNAETLESIWIYRDVLKGQPNAQITYDDGYIYTGFWTSEDGLANYACLSITDEDPENTEEAKIAKWTHTQKGGFYWAGAYIEGDYLYIGTDDGNAEGLYGESHFISINKHTGEVVDDIAIENGGDIRSSVTCSDGKLYFTSKGGFFHEAEYDPATGDIISLRSLKLENGSNNGAPMSTSTPTVYNGRAYIGVSGKGQFIPYSGHSITVIDIESWSIAYRVPTQGYPQTTGTLTTYYEKESGYVYVYFFDNFTPGRLRIIADKPGVTEPIRIIEEKVNGEVYTVGESVFEPTGALAQYCICTPIIDEDGTLYFKNDSAYLFAVGSAVEYIEVTKEPDKIKYEPGEVFDPKGMEVTAYYYNGTERDITNYVTYSTDPLEETDETFMIVYENVGSDEKPYDIINLSISDGLVKLIPEKQSSATKIRLNDTVKFDNTVDTPETFFVKDPKGGVFYAAVLSDIEYDELEIHTTGYLKGQLIKFDPEKYRPVGEKYSVYNRMTGETAEKGTGLTYERAKKLAKELNDKTESTVYEVRCESFVYVAKITVGQNYGTAFKSGTYKITAIKDGTEYTSAEYTIVTDVSILEYEYVKWAAADKDNFAKIMDDEARGYSDYLSDKNGYGDEEYMPPLMEKPTVISTTAFRAIAGKELRLLCGEGVKITVPEISAIQKGINFIYKNTVGELDSEKKATVYTLTFYGKQPVQSDFVIEWNLGVNAFQLRESFKIKVEEEDIITYYILKDGKYFDEFTVDYMTDDIDEDIILTLENEGGATLGNYSITIKRPADADSALSGGEEMNPNTGAPIF